MLQHSKFFFIIDSIWMKGNYHQYFWWWRFICIHVHAANIAKLHFSYKGYCWLSMTSLVCTPYCPSSVQSEFLKNKKGMLINSEGIILMDKKTDFRKSSASFLSYRWQTVENTPSPFPQKRTIFGENLRSTLCMLWKKFQKTSIFWKKFEDGSRTRKRIL